MALEFLPEEQRDKVSVRSTTRGGRDRGSSEAASVTLSRFWLSTGGADSKSSAQL